MEAAYQDSSCRLRTKTGATGAYASRRQSCQHGLPPERLGRKRTLTWCRRGQARGGGGPSPGLLCLVIGERPCPCPCPVTHRHGPRAPCRASPPRKHTEGRKDARADGTTALQLQNGERVGGSPPCSHEFPLVTQFALRARPVHLPWLNRRLLFL